MWFLPWCATRSMSGSVKSGASAARAVSRGTWSSAGSGSAPFVASRLNSCCPSVGGGGSWVCPNGTYQPLPASTLSATPTRPNAARIGCSSSATTSKAKRPAARTSPTTSARRSGVVTNA